MDPESGLDEQGYVLVAGDRIAELGSGEFEEGNGMHDFEIVDCKGHLLAPGLLDIQVHFREPGRNIKKQLRQAVSQPQQVV